jgi:hypothetical protein
MVRQLSLVVIASSLLLGAPTFGQQNLFSRLVGRWDKVGEGKEIIVDKSGSVFTNSDFISGSVGRCIAGGANFCFEGTHDGRRWGCAYHISFLAGGQSVDWGLTAGSHASCPRGVFARSE